MMSSVIFFLLLAWADFYCNMSVVALKHPGHILSNSPTVRRQMNKFRAFCTNAVPYCPELHEIQQSINKIPTPCQFILEATGNSANTGQQEHIQDPKIIYIADKHTEYGTLGYVLNRRKSSATVGQLNPSLRYLRDRPLYEGGAEQSGAAVTMLHQKAGFPDNRAWKGVPGKPDFKLFYSPDIAMANELCSSDDSKPSDFKFFRWATIWAPGCLEAECREGKWVVLDAPVELLFADETGDSIGGDNPSLYERVRASLEEAPGNEEYPSGG